MADHQEIIDRAVADGDAPFIVAMAGTSRGVTWSGAAGEAAKGRKAVEDTVFRIFSMTKAIGSTMAMMLMDRGKLSPDTPVEDILPEFRDVKVLEGFDGKMPRLRAPKTKCTVRHLATHTSGFVYEFWNPVLPQYMEQSGHPTILSGLNKALMYPLAFDPGTKWDYGIGIDWLGKVVEKVDGRTVDRFGAEEIFGPLGMNDTTFEVNESQKARLASVWARTPDGLVETDLAPPSKPEFYGMGHCLYSTAADYMRFIRMYLGGGAADGVRILSEAAVNTMLANQIGDLSVEKLTSIAPPVSADVDLFPGVRKTHSMAFMRVEEDVPGGMRSAGSQGWAGVLNSHYWFDPSKDIGGLIMTQMLPFADPRFMAVYAAFEKSVQSSAVR